MWLNWSVATINVALQFLDIYRFVFLSSILCIVFLHKKDYFSLSLTLSIFWLIFFFLHLCFRLCESAFFRILRPKDPGPEWKGRIWWTGPWFTAANKLFKNQVNAESSPDNIQKKWQTRISKSAKNINNVSSEGKKDRISKTIKRRWCGDPGNYEAVFH